MNVDTIFNSYRPVEHYFQLIESVIGAKSQPSVALRGLDIFLMHMVAGAYPAALSVVDLAGDATLGAVRFFWSAHRGDIRTLFGASVSWQQAVGEWRDWLPAGFEAFQIHPNVLTSLDIPLDQPGGWEAVNKKLNKLSPIMIVAAELGNTPGEIAARMKWLTDLDRRVAMVLVMPVGLTGESPLLVAANAVYSDPKNPYRFILLREISPFFAQSQLGIICRRDSEAVPEVLHRIREMYEGNFGYANLLETNYKQLQQLQALQNQTMQLSAAASQPPIMPTPAAQVITPASLQLQRSGVGQGLRGFVTQVGRQVLGRPSLPHKVAYLQATLPRMMRVGQMYDGSVQLRNDNKVAWVPPSGSANGFSVSYHWITQDGTMVVKEGIRSALPNRVEPGQTLIAPFSIATPQTPGPYILELDLVQEGVTWFSDAGTPGPRFAVNVEA